MPEYVIERDMPGVGSLANPISRALHRRAAPSFESLGRKSSGSKATSPTTDLLHLQSAEPKRSFENMPNAGASRRTRSARFAILLTRRPRSSL